MARTDLEILQAIKVAELRFFRLNNELQALLISHPSPIDGQEVSTFHGIEYEIYNTMDQMSHLVRRIQFLREITP